ncbi:NADH:flavin oxidoreductase/NADH oxidase [Ginsengibacter hankyongi]|uniref:NADH:flavin oxidoreductase/NADH oxidase n=1 Tax=Ginsengibacter hankyongi TaxID=2607284 RepID=A0A5J5IMA6_9BACT|nr:NADH:flavin oxidoreductase/NADH oxidase [Ginsengibacter hankyongi]KAA9042185.1 NADH:flavin oxidoreductase/NADH oxidase [Ginsengibacter hankyongi]
MALLFEPIKIRSIELKNRIIVSPMCEYSSIDGFANDWHLVHLGSRAVGGAGLILTEAAAVSPEGRITPDDLGIWKDEHIEFLKRITKFLEENGTVPGIQLAHAGRKASHSSPWKGSKALQNDEGAWQTLAPSAIAYKAGEPLPREMNKDDIDKVINDFSAAAERGLKAGFKVFEIHAAHGYLINEFLSPLSNKRSDEYGGQFENRIKILVEIVEAVRKVIKKDLPLFVRISATEWIEGGWNIEDSVELALILKAKGVDLIDCSSGGNSHNQKITLGALYQVPFSEKIKKESGILTGAVGLITTAEQAEEILAKGQADIIVIARQFLRDPYFPLHAARELNVDIPWPLQYERAKKA